MIRNYFANIIIARQMSHQIHEALVFEINTSFYLLTSPVNLSFCAKGLNL